MAWPNPFRRRPEPQPPAVTAAAQSFTPLSARNVRRVQQPWQDRARFFGKHLGVVRFGNGLLADLCARCQLVPERLVNAERDEWQAEDNPYVNGIIRRYRNEQADTSELIRAHVWHYSTTGDAMQVMDDRTGIVQWSIRSTQAVEFRSGGMIGRRSRVVPDGGEGRWLVKDIPNGVERDGTAWWAPFSMVRRLWVPDEDWPGLATSPLVGVLADCERYWDLGRRTRREANSALGMNGLLYTPEQAHRYGTIDGKPDPISQLDRDLDTIARMAWDDDDSPAAVAPFSVHWDGNLGEPQWVEVGRTLDPSVMEARSESLQCIARGMPLPQRLLTEGTGDASHWGDWRIAEEEVGVVESVMDRVTHADLTSTVLRPQLRAMQTRGQFNDDPQLWRMGYDTTRIVIHPDRAATSLVMYGLGLVKGEVAVDANGFDVADMMGPDELARWLLVQQSLNRRQQDASGLPVGPATTRELPPAPALSSLAAALAPYPNETASWLD